MAMAGHGATEAVMALPEVEERADISLTAEDTTVENSISLLPTSIPGIDVILNSLFVSHPNLFTDKEMATRRRKETTKFAA